MPRDNISAGASFVRGYLDHFWSVADRRDLESTLKAAQSRVEAVRDGGGKLMFAGNGASASIASHYALDFTKQAGVRSISFNDAPLLTAYANDYGYDQWVAKAIEHHGSKGDAAVLISTSGQSANMVMAAEAARQLEIRVVTLTGFEASNPLKALGDVSFWADSRAYNVVEAVHALWLGLLCDLVIGQREYGVKG